MSNPTVTQRPPRADQAAYMRWYRATFVEQRERELARRYARDRALRRLAAMHPQQMDRLYCEELRKDGSDC